MSKKLFLLISFVLLFGLVGSASAAAKFDYRVCWWSDLGPGHDWNEPNNWYTMDRYWNDADNDDEIDLLERKFYVKVHPNQVPDINCVALIGKGNARVDYPEYLHNNPPPVDPTISSGTVVAGDLLCSGGYSLDPNKDGGGSQGAVDGNQNDSWWDPCMHHELTINGGTLNVGEPQTWEGYDTWYGYGYFYGMWGGNCLRIGTVGWFTLELGPGTGQGTMHMNDGTVNVGGHMELGAWEETIGTLNMSGGTINITQGLCCPAAPWGATGRVNLHGGTINARYVFINDFTSNNSGSIDVAGGKFILSRGNEVEELTNYSNGIGLGGSGVVSLTIYGVGHGEIVTDDVNFPDANGMRAALSIDYDVSNEAKTTLQTFLTDPDQAWDPSPPDGAGNVKGTVANIARPVLSWSPGDNATSHDVYFGTSFADVNTATTASGECKENIYDPCEWTVDSDLASFATYFWRIDENPGPVKGQVWSFTMANLSKASLPSPADGATDVNPVTTLSWAEGVYAVTHDVYFSTDFNDVNDRLIDPCNTGTTNSYDPPGNGLELNTLYYWRVDECNAAGGPEWPGDVWSFTTSDHIDVDVFDSYADTAALRTVWYLPNLPGHNGAEIFVETNPDFVRSGQSMKYYYRGIFKTGGTYDGSVAEAAASALEAGTDWTASGVTTLTTYFYGDPCNGKDTTWVYNPPGPTTPWQCVDQMYVALEDGSANEGVVKYDTEHGYDMNDIKEAIWHEWNIVLQDFSDAGVALSNVSKVYLGFGGPRVGQAADGAGMGYGYADIVYFEDIELWPPKCVPSVAYPYGDITGDCVIDLHDALFMFNDWLVTDYNTVGYAGTLRGFTKDPCDPNYDLCWVPGRIGDYALDIGVGHILTDPNCTSGCYSIHEPELDDDIVIPALELNTNTVTFTCWVRSHGPQWPDSALFACDGAHGEYPGDTVVNWDLGTNGASDMGYNWNNASATWNWNPVIPELPPNEWAFCALVVSSSNASIYIKMDSDPCNLYSDSVGNSHDPEPFDIPAHIGSHKWRYFDGVIDDFRIYDRSLTLNEIKYLAFEGTKGTEPDPNIPFSWYEFDDGSGLTAMDSGGGGIVYHNVPSKANLYNEEPEYERIVNFRDYRIMADNWLSERLWPEQ